MRADVVFVGRFRSRVRFSGRRRDGIGDGNKRDGHVPLQHQVNRLELSLIIVAIVEQQLKPAELGGQLIEPK